MTCWTTSTGDGLVTIAFGYDNTSSTSETIAVGASNFFSPDPIDRFQTSTFEPGLHDNVFRVTVATDAVADLAWSINGVQVSPNLTTDARCSMCFCAAGAVGPAGDTGPTGSTGLVGPAGPKGEPGDSGPQGATGPVGIAGGSGPDGARGPAGAQGLEGPIGPEGIVGPAGPAGPEGPIGDRGTDAASASEGQAGSAGPVGQPGPVGEAGDAGVTGPRGATGAAGEAGPPGEEGPRGSKGLRGQAGPAGARGLPGSTGATGPRGADGAPTFLANGVLDATSRRHLSVDREATLVVAGVVELRATGPSEVALLVDGVQVSRMRVNGGARWMTYPLHASVSITPGEHNVQLVVPEEVDTGAASISLSAVARKPSPKRRATGR